MAKIIPTTNIIEEDKVEHVSGWANVFKDLSGITRPTNTDVLSDDEEEYSVENAFIPNFPYYN